LRRPASLHHPSCTAQMPANPSAKGNRDGICRSISVQKRHIGPFEVSALGLGCMSLSHAYGPPPPREQAERVLNGALDAGYTFLDTAAVYGLGHNERLVGEVLKTRRGEIVLASKCGMTRGEERELNGAPARLKQTCDESLTRLQVDTIDLYYLHRWDK